MKDYINEIKKETGTISIFLILIIPLMIIGGFILFDLLSVKQKENDGLKVAIACSEARLSRINEFMFKRYGLMSYLEDDSLNSDLKAYYGRNALMKNEKDWTFEIQTLSLNDPVVFLKAVQSAAPYLVSEIAIDEAMDLLDQNDKVIKTKQLIQDKLKRFETVTDKIFNSKVSKSFEDLIKAQDTLAIEFFMSKTKCELEDFELESKRLLAEEKKLNKQTSEQLLHQPEVKKYYDAIWDEKQIVEVEKALDEIINKHYLALKEIEIMKNSIFSYESELKYEKRMLRELKEELKSLKASSADLKAINKKIRLQKEMVKSAQESYDDAIDHYKRFVLSILNEEQAEKPKLLESLNLLKRNLNTLTYGFVRLENKSVDLKVSLETEQKNNPEFVKATKAITLYEKILIDEYLIAINDSLVKQRVRNFDPLNKKNKAIGVINGEMEYLIGHHADDQSNFNEIKLEIITMRSGLNLMGIVADSEKREGIGLITSPIPYPWKVLAYGGILGVWSGIEGYYDFCQLASGEGQHFLKTKGEWLLSIDQFKSIETLQSIDLDRTVSIPKGDQENYQPVKHQPINHLDEKLYYQDYIRILINLQGLDRTILRQMALIENQIKTKSDAVATLSDFKVGHKIIIEGRFSYSLLSSNKAFGLEFENGYDQHVNAGVGNEEKK